VPTEQAPVSLSKPAPTLEGHLVCDFSFDNPPVFWFGTITFGEVTYGAYFISTAPPRDYSAADPFTEYLVFYDLVTGDEYFRGLHDGMFVFKDIEGMPDAREFYDSRRNTGGIRTVRGMGGSRLLQHRPCHMGNTRSITGWIGSDCAV